MPTYRVSMDPLSRLFGRISYSGLAEGDYTGKTSTPVRRVPSADFALRGFSGSPTLGSKRGADHTLSYRVETKKGLDAEEHFDEALGMIEEIGDLGLAEEAPPPMPEEVSIGPSSDVPSAGAAKKTEEKTSEKKHPVPAGGGYSAVDDITSLGASAEETTPTAKKPAPQRKGETKVRGASPLYGGGGTGFTLGGTRSIAPEEISPPSDSPPPDYFKTQSCPEAFPAPPPALPRLPAEVSALEEMLSLAYQLPIKITRIKKLPQTRKEVKEVYFLINETNLSKVWVFKAEPEKTRNELNAYALIHGKGILTGKPLGYQHSASPYPYDVAILGGGVVEHAGDPYGQMLENLAWDPKTMFSTAEAIVRTMADYQLKLTQAKAEFEQYGIALLRADPGKEIEERLLATLGKTEAQASGLISACRQLYAAQNSTPLVSHGDCHLGNIVTVMDKKYGGTLSTKKFGMIDWGSLQFDTPFGDVQDFWLHHQRKAQQVCGHYAYSVSQLENTFLGALGEVAKAQGYELILDENDSLIQSALWNLYEMYDPTRKDPADIERKARVHQQGLWDSLDTLKEKRPCLRELTETIKKEVTAVVGEKDQSAS